MHKKLKIYYIEEEYIEYLRKYDSKVVFNKKNNRPYLGVVYTFDNFNYFAPLSSPKEKHLKINEKALDIFKIKRGKLGVVNINNMIPTPLKCLTEVLPTLSDGQYKTLIENQTIFLNNNRNKLLKKVKNFGLLVSKNNLPDNIKNRCCNFKLLEEKCKEYEKKQMNN